MHMTAKHDIEDGPLKMTNDSQGKNSESSPPASPSQAEKLSTNITNNEETAKQASQPLVAETKLYDSQANSNNVKTNEASSSSSSTPSQPWTHPLFLFGVCRWPGCESPCEDSNAFIEWVVSTFHVHYMILKYDSILAIWIKSMYWTTVQQRKLAFRCKW